MFKKLHNLDYRKLLRTQWESMVSGKVSAELSHSRLLVMMILFAGGFLVLAGRLCDVTLFTKTTVYQPHTENFSNNIRRADIVDRNGTLLAVDLSTASLYANPKKILDVKEAATKLHSALPALPYKQLLADLQAPGKSFVWIKRNMTPKEQYAVNNLGIPGLSFEYGEKRVYPHGPLFAHVLGYVGLDGKGLAGVEKEFDKRLTPDLSANKGQPEPLQLSLDSRLQNIMHEELAGAMAEFRAIGASGIVMDAKTGEVLSMVSLPDFDPHNPGTATPDQLFNRLSLGVYEMGSTFKTCTMAMALDNNSTTLHAVYDVDAPIRIARFAITDYHARGGSLTVPEIFMYSSNIGTAKIALQVGGKAQRQFLGKLGLLSPLELEIPEKAQPMYPSANRWGELSTITISYGHGIAVTSVHVVKAIGALVNGGVLYPPTLLKKTDMNQVKGERVIRPETSDKIRRLMRLVVEHGTGSKANVPGYLVGGKTGTAEKSGKGGYSQNARISSFVGAFPMTDPRYVVLVILDEPKGNKSTGGYATAGMTAAPVVGKVVGRMGPLYGIYPKDENAEEVKQKLFIDYQAPNERDTSL